MMIVVDTGPLFALADQRDLDHKKVKSFVTSERHTLVVPGPVLPEYSYLVEERLQVRAQIDLLRSIYMGEMVLEEVTVDDLPRVIDILETYADSRIGYVDAAIVAIAERRNIKAVLTLDRRHFSLIRPKHVDALELYP